MHPPFLTHASSKIIIKESRKSCFFLLKISLILNTVVSIWVQDPPSLRTAGTFAVVDSRPPKNVFGGREATTGNAPAVRRLGPTSPQEPLYHSEDEESLCPPGASVQKREPLSALYYFKTSQAPRLYKKSASIDVTRKTAITFLSR